MERGKLDEELERSAPDGGRTFRLPEGGPLSTSYGEDTYREVFGPAYERAPA